MDFSMVGLDNFVLSNSSTENGSGFQKQKRILNQDELRGLKVTKHSSFGIITEDQQKMLSFSSSSNSHSQNLALSEMSSTDMHGTLSWCKGPFTTSQWMELEHQALIYKYIIANVPVPSYLLNPIRKALESAGFPVLSGLKPNALGWGGFHLGFSNVDPEPGRCRRTDGKKWRCSKNAVAEHKYCERHMNRGRHRSRKPVEGHTASTITMTNANNHSLTSKDNADGSRYQNSMIISTASPRISLKDNQNAYNESCRPEFGLVCNDSLLNPLNTNSSLLSSRTENLKEYSNKSQHGLQQFMDEWPKNQSQHSVASDLMSSTSSSSPLRLSREPEATEMGLGMRTSIIEQGEKQASWAWETSTGGPLGEVLHSRGECKRTKALNLVESPIGPLSNQQWWE